MKRRLIEDVLPLVELNKYAQVGGGVGSLNAMHPYFARRPLTASRAMTAAALLESPSDTERTELDALLTELSSQEWPRQRENLEKIQGLIRNAHGGRRPRVLDPFSGGGAMPFEALRLGCDAVAFDLNPVAYLALHATLVFPQTYGGRTELQETDFFNISASKPRKYQLPEDVRYWASWVLQQAKLHIGDCYPEEQDGSVPVAYLWAKTVQCPYCGGEIPLIKRRWLQQDESRGDVAYSLIVDKELKQYSVEILRGAQAKNARPDLGTIRGATVECPYCGTPSERERIAHQGQNGAMGEHLLVVITNRPGEPGRNYRAANSSDKNAVLLAEQHLAELKEQGFEYWGFDRLLSVVPDEPTPPERARSVSIRLYGYTNWGMLFNVRQQLTNVVLGQQIRQVRDILAANDSAYGKVIALYLATILGRCITRNSNVVTWDPKFQKFNSIFARHDIQMTWDYAEANPFSGDRKSVV